MAKALAEFKDSKKKEHKLKEISAAAGLHSLKKWIYHFAVLHQIASCYSI